ncbi:MAG TPA: L,D-transpeptidase [Afipia sp.]
MSGTAISTALAVAIFTGVPLPAQAQVFWGPDNYEASRRFESQQLDESYEKSSLERRPQHTARIKHRRQAEPVVKEASKPQGPPIILISIDQQTLKLYDSNGLFAQSPVSTGMRGHSTPMGVFSIIGKEKFHRSNIYSGAPMPYMQRITWSGVAMHAGVLPGYPASHGCIRMPMNFAVRLYGWTRQGARVVITPNELSPSDFSHPLLFTRKPDPAPVAAAPSADISKPGISNTISTPDNASADVPADTKTTAATDKPELRSIQIPGPGTPIQTADASGAMPQKINDAMAQSVDTSADIVAGTEPKKDKDQTLQTEGKKPLPNAATSSTDAAKPDAAKAESAKPDAVKTDKTAAAPPPPKPRTGHIAAYVSRKEGKLFVRQNFEPLFEVPIEIVDRDRQLGTHVFTMRADKDNARLYRWSVVSLPVRAAAEPAPRKKGAEPIVQAPAVPPSSASEALDRLKIPDEAMQKIAEAIAPGGSITVSDQGLGGETGLGTDFIVPLR